MRRLSVFLIFFLALLSTVNAQPCTVAIQNNSIALQPAICANTVGHLQGSLPTGGNGTYAYQWEQNIGNCGNGGFTPISGATAKDFMVPSPTAASVCYRRVVTSGSCTDISNKVTVDLLDWTTPAAPTVTIVQPTCATPTGSITVTSPAPATGITYSINGTVYANTNGVFTGLAPGTYPVTAKYPAGCVSPVRSVVLSNPPPPTGTISPAVASICAGSNALLTVSGSGTSYQWKRDGSAISGATSSSYTATQGGTYTVDIISGTCTGQSSNSVVVTVVTLPTGTISPTSLTLCPGKTDTLTATGGNSYQWFKDNVLITGATAAKLPVTAPGIYSVDIVVGTCKAKATNNVTVTMGTLPSGTVQPTTGVICSGTPVVLTASGSGTYQWYRNGSPIANATGSTYSAAQAGNYTVEISNGTCSAMSSNSAVITAGTNPTGSISPATAILCPGSNQILTVNGGGTYQWYKDAVIISGATGATYNATQAGAYSVIISNGPCSGPASNTATVTQDAAPAGTISPATATICAGSSQLLTVTGNGALYQWFKDGIGISGATSSTYNATQAGVYSVDVITAGGCKAKAANNVTLTVTPLPTGTISPPTAILCAGSSVTLSATGGNTYQWFKDGSQINGAFSATFVATQPGNYTVDIFEIGGCKGKSSNEATVTVNPLPSGPITPANAVLCPGGSVVLNVTGGTSYQWYKDGIPIVGATSSTLTATAVGNYTVDIFSAGCKGGATNAGAVTQGSIPTGSISPGTATICTGNTVQLTATGGSSYQWALNGTPISGATAAVYNAPQTGVYSVTIFNNSCSGPASNTVTITPSTAITFSTTNTQPSCTSATGSITVTGPAGGTGSGYTYSKDNGASFQTSNSFSGLAAGTYPIVVKDAAGCKSNSVTVVINAFVSTLIITDVSSTTVTCTQPTATATITASGGTGPYQYSIDGSAFQGANVFNNLSAGTHKATIKDALGCVFDKNFTITQVTSTLTGTTTITNATCNQPNGAVTVQASGGSPGYTYSLDNGTYGSINSFNNLTLGQHKVTIKDQIGCLFVINFTINQTANLPNLVINNPPKICPGSTANLQAPAVTAGSDAGLAYTYWSDANATSSLINPGAVTDGTYYIRAINGVGCSLVKPVSVSLFAVNPGSISAPRLVACVGDSIVLTASLGTGYQWYRDDTLITGATSAAYKSFKTGEYSARISDGNCFVKSSNTIKLQFRNCTSINESTVFVPTAFTPNKNGANDVLRPVFYFVSTLNYFKVYNRWGQQVFETTVVGKGWDGTINGVPQPSDTYSWVLECVGKNGEAIKQSGRSFLIR